MRLSRVSRVQKDLIYMISVSLPGLHHEKHRDAQRQNIMQRTGQVDKHARPPRQHQAVA